MLSLDGKGNVQLVANDVQSEILERLRSRRGTNLYDTTYGSQLYLILNNRNVSTGQINAWVREALKPMVDNGRLRDDIQAFSIMLGGNVKINITTTSANGEQITAIFNSFLLA
jgi:hypothetical protein